jgi:hypothetical protein
VPMPRGVPKLRAALLAAALALSAVACGGRNDFNTLTDCRDDGGCECLDSADCPSGLDCLNGHCGVRQYDAGTELLPFGAACTADSECESKHCLPPGPGNGGVCTVECGISLPPCPSEWDCKTAKADGSLYLCVPPMERLCQLCSEDVDCNVIGDRCLTLGTATAPERVCGRDCSLDGKCPTGYGCSEVSNGDGGGRGKQCQPTVATCNCTQVSVGLTRACSNTNEFGSCYGKQTCAATGTGYDWSTCDAKTAAAEVCDGIDNNCNGLVDADDPAVDVSGLPAWPAYPSCRKGTGGTCFGLWACQPVADGGYGWVCTAANPDLEVCNGRDDDCNGVVDDPFIDSQGRYVHLHNCSACGYDCETAIEGLKLDATTGKPVAGAVTCELRGGAPTCVPKLCAPGSYPYPETLPVTCLEAVSSQCRACTGDGDCFVYSDRCVPVGSDPGTFCAQGCDVNAPYAGCTGQIGAQGCCPADHTCQLVGGYRLCVSNFGTCTCNAQRKGATRPCFKTSGPETCLGQETCTDDSLEDGYEWTACDTSVTAKEMCDYKDNNCDGRVDEGFLNVHGTGMYDVDEHCGDLTHGCEVNCLAMWNQTVQHAIGGCVHPSGTPHCDIVACTTETVAGGGACQRDVDCPPGRACHTLYRQCVRTCTGSSSCGGNPCVDGFCTIACASDNQCTSAFGAPSRCLDGYCRVQYHFANVDGDQTNGCECPAAVGVADEPDLYPVYPQPGWAYVDRDCDGVDGVVATSLFVWAGTTESAGARNGTRQHPYQTIAEAIARWQQSRGSFSAILVAAGSYPENVVLQNGMKLYGGYAPGFAKRDVVLYPSIIEGREPNFAGSYRNGTVNAEGITQATVLAGFTVRGYDVTYRAAPGAAGKSSYAIYVKDSTNALTIQNNLVVGGRGGDGISGVPGVAGANGGSGVVGLDSRECCDGAGCTSPASGNLNCSGWSQAGGAGGGNASCTGANGHAGGSAQGPTTYDGQQQYTSGSFDGRGGFNGQYLHSDPSQDQMCKYDCTVPNSGYSNGGDANEGTVGAGGSGGTGCAGSVGQLSGGEWLGGSGVNGASGAAGGGGGGGGAGGGMVNQNPAGCTRGNRVGDLGGTGGGGGAGGCGGTAAGGGGAGGGSFGIFVTFTSAPASRSMVRGNRIEVGMGGFGGAGGAGGHGGVGGQGGQGGVSKQPAWCAGLGGKGGRGGDGGSGGGGGGGCGGVAYGIAGNSIAAGSYQVINTIGTPPDGAGGAAGAGGASPAGGTSNGGPGSAGDAAGYHEF